MSTNSLLKGSDIFTTAIAVAPVTSWRFYDTVYTERYMQTPQENTSGYDDNSPINYADKLEGENVLILELRPGITGPASLKYANEEDILVLQEDPVKYNDEVIYPDKVKLNLDYYYNNNLWIDIKIIFATIFRTGY